MAQVKLRGPALLGRAQEELGSAREIALGNGLAFNGNTLEASGIVLTGPQGPTGPTGATGADGSGSMTGWYDVKDAAYGAVGDGVTDDAPAIQAAIDAAGAAGGGIVYIPPGTYVIRPDVADAGFPEYAALTILIDNITLMGAGMHLTKLQFQLYNGADPEDEWPLFAGAVSRGHGIAIKNHLSGPVDNITLRDFELDGGAGNTQNVSFPASVVDGDGWDLTHKGVYIKPDQDYTHILIENLYVHTWRGECIYYGGVGLEDLIVRNCWLADTNASAVSTSATNLTVEGCEIFDIYNSGTESTYDTGHHVYRDNFFHDIERNAMSVFPNLAASAGTAEIYNNRFVHCSWSSSQNCIQSAGARNLRVFNNMFLDVTGRGIVVSAPGGGGSFSESISVDNVEIFGNRFTLDTENMHSMVNLSTSAATGGTASRVQIHDNIGVTTDNARASFLGISFMIKVNLGAVEYHGSAVRIYNNFFYGDGTDSTELNKKTNYTLATTGFEYLVSITDVTYPMVKRFYVSWEVKVASTRLAIAIVWRYTDDSFKNPTVVDDTFPIGFYSAWFEIPNGGENTVGTFSLGAVAYTANQVLISAEIL